jgi:hypothetical protein
LKQDFDRFDRAKFQRRFGSTYEMIFSGVEAAPSSFQNNSWQFILLSNAFQWQRERFEALIGAAQGEGDFNIILTNTEIGLRHDCSCLISGGYPEYVAAGHQPNLAPVMAGRKALFGRSGNWGAN